MQVHGLEARQGETAFAFLVLRLGRPADRGELVRLIRQLAAMVPDAEAFIAELPEELEETMQLVGMPWLPPDPGPDVIAQRQLIERAESLGVEAAWFFQTGTSLPMQGGDLTDDDDEDDERPVPQVAAELDDGSSDGSWTDDAASSSDDADVTRTQAVQIEIEDDDDAFDELDDDDDDDDDDVDDGDDEDEDLAASWSHGPPPQVTDVRFPVDGYPAILEELDWEDFGIAFKLAGPFTSGESTVLLGFHALWLTPYGGRYRNASVTVDRTHHAAHLWVDRFSVTTPADEQVHHLLWVLSKLDEITPVLHARFGGATMAQKYGGLMGDTSEPFVLGGNPLLAIHTRGGEAGVDAWLAAQTDWSNAELAQMLRELAIEIVTETEARDKPDHGDADDDEDEDENEDEDEDGDGDDVDALFEAAGIGVVESDDAEDEDDDAEDEDDDDDEGDDENEDDAPPDSVADDDDDAGDHEDDVDEASEDDEEDGDEDDDEEDDDEEDEDDDEEGGEDEDRGRYITSYAGEVLTARARAGLLDARVAEALRPVLAMPSKYEHRRRAVVEILGALRDRESVPAMIRILEDNPIKDSLDSIAKEDFLAQTAAALGSIADPAAIPALAKLVTASGDHNDKPRPIAADALASCLAVAPQPGDLDDAVLGAMLETIRNHDDELGADMSFAYGRVAQQLAPARRADARARLTQIEPGEDEGAVLARQVALALAGGASPDPATAATLQSTLHDGLTRLAYDHESTIQSIRIALRVAEVLPDLVAADDVVWLTRFAEPDIRARAHAVLERLGRPQPPAPIIDARAAAALDDPELVRLIDEPHVVGHAALIAEAGRRRAEGARAAIIKAAHDVIDRARDGGANLLDPDARILEAAAAALRTGPLDDDTIALFDRMLRHSNYHVKWELLQEPPSDERLIPGMFHVLAEKWGWQEKTAQQWLLPFQGTAAYEQARTRAGVLPSSDDEDAAEVDEDEGVLDDLDDEDVN